MSNSCPVLGMFGFLSKRWMLLIIKSMIEGKETFGDIKRSLSGISSRILSERLTELQTEGYIERTIIQEKPIKIRYTISQKGKSLGVCIEGIDSWARENAN